MATTDEPDSIRVTRSVTIPLAEIEFRASRSSGPGGQHANTADTKIDARFDVMASVALTHAQKRRVVAKAGPIIRAVAQDERSQLRNRELATERLVHPLPEAPHLAPPRCPTKPTARAPERPPGGKKQPAAIH